MSATANQLYPCEPYDFGGTTFSVFDKYARFRWTSRDPSNSYGYVGTSVLDLYPDETRELAFERMSNWIMKGKSAAYITAVFDWPRTEHRDLINKRITLIPFDSGELAGAAISTVLPKNYHELTADDFTLLRLMADDKALKDIAHEMNRSTSAINAKVKSLKTKLGCKTLAGLVALALRSGMI